MINMNGLVTLFSVRTILNCRSLSKRFTINADGKDIPKEKNIQKKITLINPDDSLSVTDLNSAQSLSLRRDLKLVKIVDIDAKTKRPVYKLMTSTEYHQRELEHRKEKKEAGQSNNSIKGHKLLTLSTRIGNNDLMTGVKKMLKLLEKQYEVKVVIAGQADDIDSSEKIFSFIESHIKSNGRVVQKRTKGSYLKFQLLPPVREKSSVNDSSPDNNPKDNKGPL